MSVADPEEDPASPNRSEPDGAEQFDEQIIPVGDNPIIVRIGLGIAGQATNNQNQSDDDVQIVEIDSNRPESESTSNSPRPKRKRSSSSKENTSHNTEVKKEEPVEEKAFDLDDDDGSTCPICLDSWEIDGTHRLVSLKCGHLFGQSCILRWLKECQTGQRSCPSCKKRATKNDIRCIYGKRICAVDKTEEYRLRGELEKGEFTISKLQFDLSCTRTELSLQKQLTQSLERKIEGLKERLATISDDGRLSQQTKETIIRKYKLFMEKNVEISKDPGSRVMIYGPTFKTLFVSQKSTQQLFPGYGVRLLDVPSFRPGRFIHMCSKEVRDLCFDQKDNRLACASQDTNAKMFDVNNQRAVGVFKVDDNRPIWSVDFDCVRNNLLYLGTQRGSTHVFDVRNASQCLEEFHQTGDCTPVINICTVPDSNETPFGGVIVCKLQSIWFYEYTLAQKVIPTRLNVDGPFLSMSYSKETGLILISTRSSAKYPNCRYILASLVRMIDQISLDIQSTFYGSKGQQIISRSAQLKLTDDILVAAYLQDMKLLTTWSAHRQARNAALPILEVVVDICSIYDQNRTYLCALTGSKCRVYQVQPENGGL